MCTVMGVAPDPSDPVSRSTLFNWVFQFAFAASTVTIVSGALAERATFTAYLGYAGGCHRQVVGATKVGSVLCSTNGRFVVCCGWG